MTAMHVVRSARVENVRGNDDVKGEVEELGKGDDGEEAADMVSNVGSSSDDAVPITESHA